MALTPPTSSRLYPAAVAAVLALAPAVAPAQAPAQTETPQQILKKVDARLESWNTAAAREAFDKLPNKDGYDAKLAAGRLLAQEQKFEAAIQRLREAADLKPTDPLPLIHLGETYALAKNAEGFNQSYAAAAARAKAVLATKPDNVPALYALGLAQQKQRQYQESKQTLEKVRQLAPGDPMVLYQLGVTEAFLQNWQASVDRLTQSIERNPEFAYAYYYRGMAAEKIKRKDLLLNDLERFLARAPNAPDAPRARRLLQAAGM